MTKFIIKPLFAVTPGYCVLSGKAANINLIVFDLTGAVTAILNMTKFIMNVPFGNVYTIHQYCIYPVIKFAKKSYLI
jgi:hypothetical protein